MPREEGEKKNNFLNWCNNNLCDVLLAKFDKLNFSSAFTLSIYASMQWYREFVHFSFTRLFVDTSCRVFDNVKRLRREKKEEKKIIQYELENLEKSSTSESKVYNKIIVT